MKLRNYLFFTTTEHGYFLATPEELKAVLPVDPETLIPVLSNTLDRDQTPVQDSAGNKWVLLEEDDQFPEFLERLADHIRIFPHQIRERITRHETNLTAKGLIDFIETNDMSQASLTF